MGKLKQVFAPYYKQIYYSPKEKWDRFILSYLTKCEKILDVGCGVGRFIANDPKRIMGVDNSEESIKICKSYGFDVRKCNITKLPFVDNSFDAVNCSHVIEHLFPKDAYNLLKEMNRIIKPGGIMCLSTPLLHNRFYWDFTHIKPYYPQAILHYLEKNKSNQQTLQKIGSYKVIKLKYRHPQLFAISDSPVWFLSPIFNILHRFGISSFKRDGYTLILKKLN